MQRDRCLGEGAGSGEDEGGGELMTVCRSAVCPGQGWVCVCSWRLKLRETGARGDWRSWRLEADLARGLEIW